MSRIFSFFFFLGRKSKRTKVLLLLSLLPVIIAAVIKCEQMLGGRERLEGIYVFSNIIMLFNLQFLILILALFYGTSVCSEDVEGKTLTYLITRPVSKSSLVLGKYTAYTLLAIGMTVTGMIVSFLILNIDHLLEIGRYKILLRYLGVLTAGLACYSAFFAFLGSFLKRSIFFGLIFSFGWENVIQYFPGSTQRFAIAHYLKSLLPSSSVGRFSFLTFRLEPTRPLLAVLALVLITAVFLGLACFLFTQKEYIQEE